MRWPVPDYSLLTGAVAAPCMSAGGVAAGSQSTASWVAELLSVAFAEADELTARWKGDVWDDTVRDTRPPWARRYLRIRDRRAGLPGALGSSTALEDRSA